MGTNTPDPGARPGTFQSMLARLRGMAEAMRGPRPDEPEEPGESQQEAGVPVDGPGDSVASAADGAAQGCPHCGAPRRGTQTYCEDCGWIFPEQPAVPGSPERPTESGRLHDRYELVGLISERGDISRHRGLDHAEGPEPVAVVIVRAPAVPVAEAAPLGEAAASDDALADAEVLPSFEEPVPAAPATEILGSGSCWPSLAWERDLLGKAAHPSLPRVLDRFVADGFEYLIEEAPVGQALWDAWDDPDVTAEQRFLWLTHVAEGLHALHGAGAILEGLRPDIVVVTGSGLARLTDVSDLLPMPLPAAPPIRATFYTAPELVVASDRADARSDLYSFGAMVYALHVGRELADMDFERSGTPKPFIPRFPDIHPLFGRLISKTFCREVQGRFPSDEAAQGDTTGFTELVRVLNACRRSLDNVRLEIAAWTTTGMVRTGNEDAFALLHGVESRQDDMSESALLFLCDGMGGYEAGEVAAALTIDALRKNLLAEPAFRFLAGGSGFASETAPTAEAVIDAEACKKLLATALRDANRLVYDAARRGVGRRGMGCTAEAVFVSPRYVAVGHVGDSRTYVLHCGKLMQLTRDHTLVSRLVELGQLTEAEAEIHPRRSELQQAIGGHAEVEPAVYHCPLLPGDWVVVCSDGVSNHISADELKQILQSEATSAEMAARRLVNFVNLKGATDNATVVVVRAT